MKFLEKDLEEIIYNTYLSSPEKLRKKNLYMHGSIKRQLKIGNYGILDLLTISRDYDYEYKPVWIEKDSVFREKWVLIPTLVLTVYELKKEKVGISAFLQCYGYIKGLKDWFKKHKPTIKVRFESVLIGKELDTSGSFCFLPELIHELEVYTYSYDVDGLNFENVREYSLKNKGF